MEIAIRPLSLDGSHPPFCSCNDCRIAQRESALKMRPDRAPLEMHSKSQYEHKRHLMNHEKWRANPHREIANDESNDGKAGIAGRSRSRKRKRRRQLFVHESVKKMCREMMDGLVALHTANEGCIIHRDIKPQNILISREEHDDEAAFRCKLADMGIAKLMDPSRMSFDTENCGTLFWNAPELVYWKSISNLKRLLHGQDVPISAPHRISPDTSLRMRDMKSGLDPNEESTAEYVDSSQFTLALGSIFGEHEVNQVISPHLQGDNDEDEVKEMENSLSLSRSVSRGTSPDDQDVDREDEMEWLSSRLTPAVDIFSLGCVFSFLLSGGSHPFGDCLVDQRENMERRRPNLEYLQQSVPAAYDLICWMINVDPLARPKAMECRLHPFFWSDARTLQFLLDTSDFIEKSDKSHALRVTLEMASYDVIGPDWAQFVDAEMLCDAGKHRKYSFASMRDYLRLIRNKWTHFAELPATLRHKLGDENLMKSESKFLQYFTQFTPKLVMYCYKLMASAIGNGDIRLAPFERYYGEMTMQRLEAYRMEVRVQRFRRWMSRC